MKRRVFTTPLHMACLHGDISKAKRWLAKKGTNVNKKDKSGLTPLIRACLGGHVRIIELLLADPRIDVNLADDSSYHPIGCVLGIASDTIVKRFLVHPKLILPEVPTQAVFHPDKLKWIREFMNDQEGFRKRIRKELGLVDKDAASVFALLGFQADGLIELAP